MAGAQMQKIVNITSDDVANPAEVAAAFEMVFKAIETIKKALETADTDTQTKAEAGTKAVRDAVAALEKKTDLSVADLRKLVGSLLKWKEVEQLRTTDGDLADVVELTDQHTSQINGIEEALRKMKLLHGKDGRTPDHEWDGTKLRFEQPDGQWGEWVDLRGLPGEGGGGFSMFGSGMGGVRRIRAGTGITITGDPGEPTIIATGGGGGSTTLITEALTGTQSGNDVLLDFTGLAHVPTSILFVSRQGQVQAPAASAPADGSSAVNITGTASAVVYNADAASEIFLVGYGY